ncbi:MAG: TetR/AcrR family transcriptional regulator, partial [Methylocystaceae bacterium]
MRKVDPQKHETKRRRILDAAARCFARDGFRGASISGICAEAGISPGLLYHYFASKEAIIAAMTESGLDYAAARFGQMTAEEDIVQALVAELDWEKMQEWRPLALLSLEMAAEAGRNPAIASLLQEHSRKLRSLLAEHLRLGQQRGQIDATLDADLAASVLMSVIDGAKSLPIKDPAVDMVAALGSMRRMV